MSGVPISPLTARTPSGWSEVANRPEDERPAPDPYLLELVESEMGVTGTEALDAASSLAARIRYRQVAQLADQIVSSRTAERDQRLAAAQVVTARSFVEESDCPPLPLLGQLVSEGHNATVTAQFKAGKTELVLNACAALAEGGLFLGRFDTGRPRRTALLNFELTADDQRSRIRDLGMSAEALERLLVVNLRGTRLSLTTPTGRDWLVRVLSDHGAEVLIGDTFGAASAPSVESENDNAGVRRFLAALDEIKALACCASSIWTAHTGRKDHAEGSEHARGATVIDDWADVRLILTKDRNTGIRFISSEGRSDYDLPESALHYDRETRALWLTDGTVGVSRADRRQQAAAATVRKAVEDQPGLTATELRDVLSDSGIAGNGDKSAAITKARTMALIHIHRDGHKVRHFAGAPHPEGTPCPK